MEELLTIRNLRVWFDVRIGFIAGLVGKEQKHVRAVDDVSFRVKRGEVFCLVGESGCGKTTTGKALIRLNEATKGSIFFDIPDADWNEFAATEKRLADLKPILAKTPSADLKAAEAAWKEIRRLTKRADAIRTPPGELARLARCERMEKTMAFLDLREKDLLRGADPAVQRVLSKYRTRLELIEQRGAWFTPARAQKLAKLEKQLKEARYQVVRAESQQLKTGKVERRVRRLERKVRRAGSRETPKDPAKAERIRTETAAKIKGLRADIDARTKSLTDLELARVREERKLLEPRLQAAKVPVVSKNAGELPGIEAAIAAKRRERGLPLEARELRARLERIGGRYDLAKWGTKGEGLGPRRGRRKRYHARMRELRRRMQIIYQDPYESLNPKLSIYDIVSEPLLANRVTTTQAEAQAAVAKSLEDVGLRPAQEYMFRYPHELSGGQRQRVGIATALVVDPDFIVADEPVSMLDASVRTEIIALLLDLRKRRNLTYLFITHDLGLAWIIADRIGVMYLGKIVEMGNAPEIIQNPRHPYTKALISVVPSPNPSIRREKTILRGERPDPVDIPGGCRFHPRCPMAVGICGWEVGEVKDELEKLLQEDREAYVAPRSVSAVTVVNPSSLLLSTSEAAEVEAYLRKRVQSVGLERPALGAIRDMKRSGDALKLTLHKPAEPRLKRITGDISVACHLVAPDLGPPGPAGTVSAAATS